jgi:cytochrome c553
VPSRATEAAGLPTVPSHKDARKYPATGGWGFEGFKGASKTERAVGQNAAAACYECHTAQKNHDFVFSTFRK